MKRVLTIIGISILAGYFLFSAFYFKDKPEDAICTGFSLKMDNEEEQTLFIDMEKTLASIDKGGLNPVGKPLSEINTIDIESFILKNDLVKDAQAYVTDNREIKVRIIERQPILRVIANNGENYYIDSQGKKMALSQYFTAHLPVATGAIKEDFSKEELYDFALFLLKDDFWNAQIEQIVVANNEDITLIPRVGGQEILLGKIDNYKKKLDRLMIFYQKELNRIGWNKYSIINLKFDKQIVATKR